MAVYDFYPFAYDDVAEYWKEGEDCGKRSFAVDYEEGHIVDLQPVREVSDACSAGIRVRNNYYFVTAVNEFLGLVSNEQGMG